jgi:hypothetical protein
MTNPKSSNVRIRSDVFTNFKELSTTTGEPFSELINNALREWLQGYSSVGLKRKASQSSTSIDNHNSFED